MAQASPQPSPSPLPVFSCTLGGCWNVWNFLDCIRSRRESLCRWSRFIQPEFPEHLQVPGPVLGAGDGVENRERGFPLPGPTSWLGGHTVHQVTKLKKYQINGQQEAAVSAWLCSHVGGGMAGLSRWACAWVRPAPALVGLFCFVNGVSTESYNPELPTFSRPSLRMKTHSVG